MQGDRPLIEAECALDRRAASDHFDADTSAGQYENV